jgi:hypothetical protein
MPDLKKKNPGQETVYIVSEVLSANCANYTNGKLQSSFFRRLCRLIPQNAAKIRAINNNKRINQGVVELLTVVSRTKNNNCETIISL